MAWNFSPRLLTIEQKHPKVAALISLGRVLGADDVDLGMNLIIAKLKPPVKYLDAPYCSPQ